MDFSFAAAGFTVGLVVGLTGVGGGALMTPLLIFIFGVAPKTAIGTDLFFAALTKVFGVLVHGRHGTIDWQVFRRLSSGSVPAALVTVAVLQWLPVAKSSLEFLLKALSVALFVTALGLYFKGPLYALGRRRRLRAPESFKVIQLPLTVLAGIVLGVMVSLTSVGAGALGAVFLVYLYPLRMTGSKLVGTDLLHAIPLALVAGAGYWATGDMDFPLLGNLLAGSIPGVVLGSVLSARLPERAVRVGVATVLLMASTKAWLSG